MTNAVELVDERLVEKTVALERASVFNERLVASAWVSPLGIGFVAWLLAESVGMRQAALWVTLILSLEILVIGFGRAFRHAVRQAEPVRTWLNAQAACCGLLGLVWGSATWFVWAPNQFLLYVTTLCVLVGVSFICMVVMAPVRRALGSFALGLLILPVLQLAFIDNPVGREIGVGWVVMLAVQVHYSRELRRELIRQIDSSVRNVMLVARLTDVGRELTQANAEKEARNSELNAAMEQLNQLVTFDQLTGAFSRRYLMEELERQVALRTRYGAPVSLIMLDLDHFKSINDQHGHAVGDHALRETARLAKAELRDGDLFGRVGGEEFLVLLPMTDGKAASVLAERLRAALEKAGWMEAEQLIRIPASMGVAELRSGEDAASWLRRVDAALYEAKSTGRNRVVVAA